MISHPRRKHGSVRDEEHVSAILLILLTLSVRRRVSPNFSMIIDMFNLKAAVSTELAVTLTDVIEEMSHLHLHCTLKRIWSCKQYWVALRNTT